MSTNSLPNISDRFLSKPEVLRIAGFSAATLWREVTAGRFPAPVCTSAQRKGFLESEVRMWMANKIVDRLTLPKRTQTLARLRAP